MKFSITPPKSLIFLTLPIMLLLINMLLDSNIIGVFSLIGYFIFSSWIGADTLLDVELNQYLRYILSFLLTMSMTGLIAVIARQLGNLNKEWSFLLLIPVPLAYFAYGQKKKIQRSITVGTDKSFYVKSLFLIAIFSIIIFYMWNSRTVISISNPFDVSPCFPLVFFIFSFLLIIFLLDDKSNTPIRFIAISMILFMVAGIYLLITGPPDLGYFSHIALERRIAEYGRANVLSGSPENIPYTFQYSIVALVSQITRVDSYWVHQIIGPILFAVSMPVLVTIIVSSITKSETTKKIAPLLLLISPNTVYLISVSQAPSALAMVFLFGEITFWLLSFQSQEKNKKKYVTFSLLLALSTILTQPQVGTYAFALILICAYILLFTRHSINIRQFKWSIAKLLGMIIVILVASLTLAIVYLFSETLMEGSSFGYIAIWSPDFTIERFMQYFFPPLWLGPASNLLEFFNVFFLKNFHPYFVYLSVLVGYIAAFKLEKKRFSALIMLSLYLMANINIFIQDFLFYQKNLGWTDIYRFVHHQDLFAVGFIAVTIGLTFDLISRKLPKLVYFRFERRKK